MISNKLTVQKALFESQGLTPVTATCLEGHKLLLSYPDVGSSTVLLNIDAYIKINTVPLPATSLSSSARHENADSSSVVRCNDVITRAIVSTANIATVKHTSVTVTAKLLSSSR